MGGEEVVRIWGKARRWFLRVMYKLKQDRYGDITYVLRNKKSKSDFLIAVFSGFSPKGTAPRYNYGETLKKVDAMQVFLLDDTGYNKAGSYYLGENGTWYIPEQICQLISELMTRYQKRAVLTCGSSKGGTAAVYYGLRLNATAVIIGAPQYLIGNYLNTPDHRVILEKILGSITEEGINRLNSLLEDEIRHYSNTEQKPSFYIHYSPLEHTYHEHIDKLISELRENNYPLELDCSEAYDDHADVGRFFQKYLVETCNRYV